MTHCATHFSRKGNVRSLTSQAEHWKLLVEYWLVSRLQGEGIFSHYLEDVRAVRLILKLNKNRNYSSCFVWRFISFALNSWLTFTGVKPGCCCGGGSTKNQSSSSTPRADGQRKGWGAERPELFFYSMSSKWHVWVQRDKEFLLLTLDPVRADWCNWYPSEQAIPPFLPRNESQRARVQLPSFLQLLPDHLAHSN